MSIFASLLPRADAVAASATNAALNQAAARPFTVILQVEQNTKIWIGVLLLFGAVVAILKK